MILQMIAGALGALMASGLLALGFFIGRRTGRGPGGPVPSGEDGAARRELEEQQAAFEQLLRYGAEDAYKTRERWKGDER